MLVLKNKILQSKIQMFINFSPTFKTYFIVINNQLQKNKELKKDKILFKAIKEEKTYIKAKSKASIYFATTMQLFQFLKKTAP